MVLQMFFFVVSIHLLFIVNANSKHLCSMCVCENRMQSENNENDDLKNKEKSEKNVNAE